MQPKLQEKRLALRLRAKGLSYSEILEQVPVSHASLSLWLRHIALTDKQKERLVAKSQGEGAKARHQDRLDKQSKLKDVADLEIVELLKDPFFTFGLALFWAEGNKQKPWSLSSRVIFANSDSNLILLMREWFKTYCNVENSNIDYELYIHETAEQNLAKNTWCKLLSIKSNDIQVRFKRNVIKGRHKQDSYKGLVRLVIRKSTWLSRRIDFWTQGAAEYFLEQ